MRKIAQWVLTCVLLSIAVVACKQPQETVTEKNIVLNSDDLKSYLKNKFENPFYLYCQEQLRYLDTLSSFYKSRDYEPLWWDALLGDSAAWEALESDIMYSEVHGMDRRYYYLGMLQYYRTQVNSFSTADSAYELLSEMEILTSNALIQMYSDIANGRTTPEVVFGATYQLPLNNQKKLDWEKFLESKDKPEILENLHANDTTYNQLLGLLSTYRKKQMLETYRPIDFSAHPKIEPGDTAAVLVQVIQKLKSDIEPDSSILDIEESMVYSRKFAEVIKVLQEKYNLMADGVLGYKTYKVINSTASERINQIVANLERQRWFNKPPLESAPFIYVNLPEYMVYLNYPDSVQSMKICIGKNLPDDYDNLLQRYTDSGWLYKLPKNMETPQIHARVSIAVINPTWTVPRSIIQREMYWSMRRDPNYLRSHNYRVYYRDKEVQSDTIDWSRYTPKKVPYRIVQDPGDENSLGFVKYIFWNKFDIFMHDTPLKKKFEQSQRAVSHGCVRLENPILFGEFVMQSSRKYDSDDFRILMGYPPTDSIRLEEYDPEDSTAEIQAVDTTFEIRLEKPIPLYMDYRTVYFSADWKAHFCYDIYDKNRFILRRMEEF
ncbi:L,D-transpeptidase family protein [bacterium]|nr:L,D-transpeptidase family protein [bacterium]